MRDPGSHLDIADTPDAPVSVTEMLRRLRARAQREAEEETKRLLADEELAAKRQARADATAALIVRVLQIPPGEGRDQYMALCLSPEEREMVTRMQPAFDAMKAQQTEDTSARS